MGPPSCDKAAKAGQSLLQYKHHPSEYGMGFSTESFLLGKHAQIINHQLLASACKNLREILLIVKCKLQYNEAWLVLSKFMKAFENHNEYMCFNSHKCKTIFKTV